MYYNYSYIQQITHHTTYCVSCAYNRKVMDTQYTVFQLMCNPWYTTIFSLFSPDLVRDIDPERKLFYITTPESPTSLSRVNCLLAGNTISPHVLVPQDHIKERCPYLLPHFTHTNTGTFGYQNI